MLKIDLLQMIGNVMLVIQMVKNIVEDQKADFELDFHGYLRCLIHVFLIHLFATLIGISIIGYQIVKK